ncbi:lysophospholipid acyltransferase family protein [Thioclava indica]|uniref:Phospholipid/glycerol acyltransferase domain-containing protein n=1 Tax=Thioclava indica TaxID=1353528 RepID=A0A074JLV2_9RHOB|nr:1-acyl-sn-glycerol-3-phosphate acyltransferase [Thioclava indica]KEO57459.1 hypothetical protein DT23_05150 [Thioclava indica]
MNDAVKSHLPGRITWFSYVRAAVFYVHIALATLVFGIWGLIFQLPRGRVGAHKVASVWSGHLLAAARFYLGLRYELRGEMPEGDCLVGAKHQSFFDILIIAHHMPQRSFIMKKQIMNVPIMGWYALQAGCIPIDRSRGSEAMKAMLEGVKKAQKEGLGQLIIYPEGTRTRPGEKRRYKQGIGVIADATGLPVYPVATNVGLFWSKRGWPIHSGVGVVEFMPPIPAGLSAPGVLSELQERVETQSDALMAEAGFVAPQGEPAA